MLVKWIYYVNRCCSRKQNWILQKRAQWRIYGSLFAIDGNELNLIWKPSLVFANCHLTDLEHQRGGRGESQKKVEYLKNVGSRGWRSSSSPSESGAMYFTSKVTGESECVSTSTASLCMAWNCIISHSIHHSSQCLQTQANYPICNHSISKKSILSTAIHFFKALLKHLKKSNSSEFLDLSSYLLFSCF